MASISGVAVMKHSHDFNETKMYTIKHAAQALPSLREALLSVEMWRKLYVKAVA